jgi:hypothetical protein
MSKKNYRNRSGLNGFSIVSNSFLNCPLFSMKEKFLYIYLSSKPDGWHFSIERISIEHRDSVHAIRSGLQDLEDKRLLLRDRQFSGRISHTLLPFEPAILEYDPNFLDTTLRKPEDGATLRKPEDGKGPHYGNPMVGKPHGGKTVGLSNTDIKAINKNKGLNARCAAQNYDKMISALPPTENTPSLFVEPILDAYGCRYKVYPDQRISQRRYLETLDLNLEVISKIVLKISDLNFKPPGESLMSFVAFCLKSNSSRSLKPSARPLKLDFDDEITSDQAINLLPEHLRPNREDR